MSRHRFTRARQATLLAVVLAVGPLTLLTGSATASPNRSRTETGAAQVARDWQRTALRTVYTEGATPIPSGTLYLGFTSLAVDRAVQGAGRGRHTSSRAAVAVAAHDVLRHYFPGSAAGLDVDLATSLAAVPDGRAEERGARIGRAAAQRMIASRAGDRIPDPTVVYRRDAAPGVWQPPATGMLVPWLGFVDPLVLRRPVRVDGPDSLTSGAYAADFAEVKRVGSATASPADRSPEQTATAQFFNFNAVVLYRAALLEHLDSAHLSLARTTQLFAALDAATADTMIQCWGIKYRYGFWRPQQAIQGAATDGNPATVADAQWAPLLANPPYPDYLSGHGCITSAFAGVVRSFFGDRLPLLLRSGSTNTVQRYETLSAMEHDAFMARIWSGIHFRDAMVDAYQLGHATARRVVGERDRRW
jgi:hypothetical protein